MNRPGLDSTEDLRQQIQTRQSGIEQAETRLEQMNRMGNEDGGYIRRPRDEAVGQFRDRDLTNQARAQSNLAEQSQIREQGGIDIPRQLVERVGGAGVGDAEAMAEGEQFLEGVGELNPRALRGRNREYQGGLMRGDSMTTLTRTAELSEGQFPPQGELEY